MQYNIPDVHPATVISAFHQNVHNRKMHEELVMNKVRDVAELYVLADRCARTEEGRKYPSEDAGAETDSTNDTATLAKKGRHRNRKRRGKTVLAVDGSDDTSATKKPKVSDPGKEFAGCAACRALAAADKPGGFDKQYCKIHRTKGHDLQNYRQLEQLAEKQKPSMSGGTRRRAKRVPRDPARSVAAKEAVAARITNKRGPLGAATRNKKTTIMTRTTSLVGKGSRTLWRPCRRWRRLASYLSPPAQAVGA